MAECIYGDAGDLVVLVIDSARLPVPVKYEASEPGAESYPHIYGPLPIEAVIDVIAVRRDADERAIRGMRDDMHRLRVAWPWGLARTWPSCLDRRAGWEPPQLRRT